MSNIFKSGTFTWWQMGMLKISILALGIVIGASWPQVLAPYAWWLVGLAIAAGLYPGYIWLKQ